MSSEAFVTLATNDGYGLGALVLAQSIRQVGTKRNLVVLVSNHLSDLIRQTLETTFDEVIVVDELNSNDKEHLTLLARPELGITFTKINSWLLVQYTKCVFLDADCVVLRNIDDLFDREELSAAPDAGWPDCFNSGVFVFQPSKDTFTKLMLYASQQNVSFDGGDQGLLNGFFSNWRSGDISRHLPFTYNVTANAFYSYLPAVTRFRNDIHIVHFAGALKPWQLTYNPQNGQLSGNLGGQSDMQRDFLLSWWTVMYQRVWPQLSNYNQQSNTNDKSSNDGEGQFASQFLGSLNYGSLTNNKGIELGSVAHRRAWEAGHIDYYGRDSFSNIQQQLERNIAQNPQQYHPSQQRQTTPPLQQQTTNLSKETTPPLSQTTNLVKSSLKESTPPPPLQQSTTVVKSSLKESATPPPLQQSTTVVKSSLIESAAPSVQQTASVVKSSLKETVTPLQQTTTVVNSLSKESAAPAAQQTASVLKSSLKESVTPLQQTTTVVNSLSKESATPLQQTTNLPKTLLKTQTPSSFETTQSVLGSTLPTEHKSSTAEHDVNWTVKSTIVTAYTQGVGELAGPTVVSKSVSETLASSSNDIPTVTSIKYKTDSTDSSGSNLTAKTPNDHFAWLFDKLFVAITYMISLCYLVFLVTMRRSKDSSLTHGNGTSVRGAATQASNGNRVNK